MGIENDLERSKRKFLVETAHWGVCGEGRISRWGKNEGSIFFIYEISLGDLIMLVNQEISLVLQRKERKKGNLVLVGSNGSWR